MDDEDLWNNYAWVRMEQRKYKEPIVTEIVKLDNYYSLLKSTIRTIWTRILAVTCHWYEEKVMEIPFVDAMGLQTCGKRKSWGKDLMILSTKVACENFTRRDLLIMNTGMWWEGKRNLCDIATGEPCFCQRTSLMQVAAWPGFSNPYIRRCIVEVDDLSHGTWEGIAKLEAG